MNKKLMALTACVMTTMTLTACGTPSTVDMTFDDAYKSMTENQSLIVRGKDMSAISMDGDRRISSDTRMDIESKNMSGMSIATDIKTNTITKDALNASGSIDVNATATLEEEKYTMNLGLQTAQKDQKDKLPQEFIKLVSAEIKTPDAKQNALLNIVMSMMRDRRIQMDTGTMDMGIDNPLSQSKEIIANILKVTENVASDKFLINKGEIEVDGKRAFNVEVDSNQFATMIEGIMSGTLLDGKVDYVKIKDMKIGGMMILNAPDDVEFHTTKMGNTDTRSMKIKKNEIEIIKNKTDTDNVSITVKIERDDDDILIEAKMSNDDANVIVDMKVNTDIGDDQTVTKYEGDIEMSGREFINPQVGKDKKETGIDIAIKGKTTSKKITEEFVPTEITGAIQLPELLELGRALMNMTGEGALENNQ